MQNLELKPKNFSLKKAYYWGYPIIQAVKGESILSQKKNTGLPDGPWVDKKINILLYIL